VTGEETIFVVSAPSLKDLYERILRDAPAATVRVPLYPPLVPGSITADACKFRLKNAKGEDSKVDVVLLKGVIPLLHKAEEELNAAVSKAVDGAAATKLGAGRIASVSLDAAFATHTICNSKDGATTTNTTLFNLPERFPVPNETLHPTADGYAQIAKTVLATL
jgi:hypothetical protein